MLHVIGGRTADMSAGINLAGLQKVCVMQWIPNVTAQLVLHIRALRVRYMINPGYQCHHDRSNACTVVIVTVHAIANASANLWV